MKHSQAYTKARAFILDRFGSEQNACAATVSMHLRDAGLIGRIYVGTGDLCDALQDLNPEYILSISKLERGDICFSSDLEGRLGAPDHVYIMWDRTTGSSEALILDNYSPDAHMRNLRKGKRTPFAFALRFPEVTNYFTDIPR